MRWFSASVIALALAGAGLAQDVELQAELMGPLGTQTAHKGDKVFARVVSPDPLKGDMLEGKVTEVRNGNKIHGTSVLNFSFETLQHAGQAIPVATEIKTIANSKGQLDVDEEGRVIRKSSNLGKAAIGTAAGGLLGGVLGGVKGAAIGAGAGAVASVILIQVAAEGPSIRFDPGSKVTLSAKSRGGPDLAGLAPAEAPAAAEAPAPAPAAADAAAPAEPVAAAAPAAAPAAEGTAQPALAALKDDFIPGEKVLFYDDFTDMAADEPPPHWKVRGTAMALKEGGGIRQLTASSEKTFLTPNLKVFPKNFTMETELKFDNPGDYRSIWEFFAADSGDNPALRLWMQTRTGSLNVQAKTDKEDLGEAEPAVDFNRPVKEALWVQNGRLRLYINGQKVVDTNQVELSALQTARLEAELYGDGGSIGYRMVRIAESTPDFSQSISAGGRYVTHGILFDTDSDRLKTESAAVIQSIARGLAANPNLKLRIEGHTDSTGAADHNLDLSKRRAEAVMSVLVSQFNVDASRLTAGGLGATKPIDSNDTAQGRAENRRVEFVKQ